MNGSMALRKRDNYVHVIVLGDIAHSPRMINHCECFAANSAKVRLVGFEENELPVIARQKSVEFFPLHSFAIVSQCLPHFFSILIRGLLLMLQLFFYCLIRVKKNETILVQNPPALPILIVLLLLKPIKYVRIFIDWHNFGHSLMALKYGSNCIFVKMHYWIEGWVYKIATGHFCVTSAMKLAIVREFNVDYESITVCYDKPKESFQKTSEVQADKVIHY